MATPPLRTGLADTYPNPSNAVFRTAIGALWDYVTGLLGSTGNAAEARNAFGIGSVFSFRNLLINGNFAINQRGYASAAATTGANQYTLDRWRVVTSGQNASFGAAAPDRTVTCPAGGVEQVIEGSSIVGGVYTLSWVGSATATVNGVSISNGAQTSSLSANSNVTVRFISGTVGQAQFELGAVATPFERRHPGIELNLCQRYYAKTFNQGVAPTQNVGNGQGAVIFFTNQAAGFFAQWVYPVEMRAPPTLTTYNPLAAASSWRAVNGSGSVNYAVVAGAVGTRQAYLGAASSSAGAEGYIVHITADAEL